jgi:hypothetical protein
MPVSAPVVAKTPAVSATVASPSKSAKYIGMIVVGILAGVVIAWGATSFRSSSVAENGSADGTASTSKNLGVDTTSVPSLGSDPSLTIMSPQPAGMSVQVAKAIVSSPTWVVVYEDSNGKPGNALGAALFFPEHQTGAVELLRATSPGKNYLVVRQMDNGDRKFSLKDDQFLSEGGEVQWVTFQTR